MELIQNLLGTLYVYDLAAFVLAGLRVDTMRHLGFARILISIKLRGFERVMSSSLTGPRVRMSSFWIWHKINLNSRSRIRIGDQFEIRDLNYFKFLRAAQRGSISSPAQLQSVKFRFAPHCSHNPLQSGLQKFCIGSARSICSLATSARSTFPSGAGETSSSSVLTSTSALLGTQCISTD